MFPKLKIKLLQLRMYLGIDPAARRAAQRYNDLQTEFEKARIRRKAIGFDFAVQEAVIDSGIGTRHGDVTLLRFPKKVGFKVAETEDEGRETFNGIEVEVEETEDALAKFRELQEQYAEGAALCKPATDNRFREVFQPCDNVVEGADPWAKLVRVD